MENKGYSRLQKAIQNFTDAEYARDHESRKRAIEEMSAALAEDIEQTEKSSMEIEENGKE